MINFIVNRFLDTCSSYITQEIAKEDQKAYGTYMQRSSEKDKWSYYNKPMETRISATKKQVILSVIHSPKTPEYPVLTFPLSPFLNDLYKE